MTTKVQAKATATKQEMLKTLQAISNRVDNSPKLLTGQLHLYFDGDSITAGQSLSAGQSWPVAVAARVRGGATYHHNDGAPSALTEDLIAEYPTHTRVKFDPTVPNAYILMIGVNNLNGPQSDSAATLYGKLLTLCKLAKNDGHTVFICEVWPSTVITAGEETQRLLLNDTYLPQLVAAGAADVILRGRECPETQNPSNTVMFPDGLHPSATLCSIWGAFVAGKVNDYYGGFEANASVITSGHDLGYQCVQEVRADQGMTLAGLDITTWADISGNGNDWGDSTGVANLPGSKPSLILDDGDGLPCVDFDATHGNGEAFILNKATLRTTGPYHVMMLIKPNDTNNGIVWAQSDTTSFGTKQITLQIDNANPPFVSYTHTFDNGVNWTVGDPDSPLVRFPPTITKTAWHLLEMIDDGTRLRIIVDDKECMNLLSTATTNTALTNVRQALGASWTSVGIFSAKTFKLRHMTQHNGVLPWAKRRDLRNFMLSEWSPRFAEISTDQAIAGTGAFVDLANLSLAVTITKQTTLEAVLNASGSTLVGAATLQIVVDQVTPGVFVAKRGLTIPAAAAGGGAVKARIQVGPGTYTFKVQQKSAGGSTLQIRPATQIGESASLSVRAAA
jgi:hypothetical protein